MSSVELIAPQPTKIAPVKQSTAEYLLQVAVESGADLDKLERLMQMHEQWQRNEAQRAYNEAFSAFKGEAVHIFKDKTIGAGPLQGRKYASLQGVISSITPALSRHGLSAFWKLTKDEPQWLEVTCTLRHIGGHSESVSMGGPPDAGGAKNAIQARASTVSYLERYTLKAITGLSEEDDDDNGASAGPGHPCVGGPRPAVDRTMLMKVRRAIADKLANGHELGALQEWEEACALSEEFAGDVWAGLTTDDRNKLRTLKNESGAKE